MASVDRAILFPDFHQRHCQGSKLFVDPQHQFILLQSLIQHLRWEACARWQLHTCLAGILLGAMSVSTIAVTPVIPDHDLTVGMQLAKILEGALINRDAGQDLTLLRSS